MEHLDLTWSGIMVALTLIGMVIAAVSSVITHIITMYKVRKDLVDNDELDKAIKSCQEKREERHKMCSGNVAEQLTKQSEISENQRELLEKGDKEFTALRLAMSEIFDALKIPGGRERWLQIRDDVMNDRTT